MRSFRVRVSSTAAGVRSRRSCRCVPVNRAPSPMTMRGAWMLPSRDAGREELDALVGAHVADDASRDDDGAGRDLGQDDAVRADPKRFRDLHAALHAALHEDVLVPEELSLEPDLRADDGRAGTPGSPRPAGAGPPLFPKIAIARRESNRGDRAAATGAGTLASTAAPARPDIREPARIAAFEASVRTPNRR